MCSDSSNNIILLADSYKSSHHVQYPPGTSHIYAYFESRGGRFPYSVFFGLQYILKRYLCGRVVTKEKIDEAKKFFALHFGDATIFNEEGWTHILENYGGHLPVKISAVPEGSVIPTRNVLFTIENTDPKLPWLTCYLETILSQTWYPMTVATLSRIEKQIINRYLLETNDSASSLPFKLHDFGFRGVSSIESAGLGAAAHLVNFMGSDTVQGILMAKDYYYAEMAGYSIPAAEHSTIIAWEQNGEINAFENILNKFSKNVVSIVVDSYDVFKASEEFIGEKLKSKIIENGKNGGVLVVRPDSGNPLTVVLKILEILGKAFGTEVNSKGFKLLPTFIRVLQGDGVNFEMIDKLLKHLKENGWAAENVGFGSGGSLLQKVNRDTLKCAFKPSQCTINGESVEVFKSPITDPGKKSKHGRLSLQKKGNIYITKEHGEGDPLQDLLEVVFENGKLVKDWTFEEIRKRAELSSEDPDIEEFMAQLQKEDSDEV